MDLTDIYETFHPKTKGYTFFSGPHVTFSKIDHIMVHNTGLHKYKKINPMHPIRSPWTKAGLKYQQKQQNDMQNVQVLINEYSP